jgi:ATP-dependent Clp protease ATP-binding subunit ClpA
VAGRGVLIEVFERFTDRAQRVVVLVQEEARMLNHNYLGTEHLLLSLVREGEGVAAQVLVKLGAGLTGVRRQVVHLGTRCGWQAAARRASPAGQARTGPATR